MANSAVLPNITLPFFLPPVNLSTIYQGEKNHHSNGAHVFGHKFLWKGNYLLNKTDSSHSWDYFEPLNLSLPLNISALNPVLENLPLNPWKTPSRYLMLLKKQSSIMLMKRHIKCFLLPTRDPTDWLTDGATLGLIAALIQMIAGAGFESLQVNLVKYW